MEIEHGNIQKEFLHYKTSNTRSSASEKKCHECPIGLNMKYDERRNRSLNFTVLDQIIKQETWFNDENIEIYHGGEEP